jgi:hypothetical protein
MSKKSKRKLQAKKSKRKLQAKTKIDNQSLMVNIKDDNGVICRRNRLTMACLAFGKYDCTFTGDALAGNDYCLECQSDDPSIINVENWKIVPSNLKKKGKFYRPNIC